VSKYNSFFRKTPISPFPLPADAGTFVVLTSPLARLTVHSTTSALLPEINEHTCYVDPSWYGNGEICGPSIHGTPVFWQDANSSFGYVYGMPEKDYLKAFYYDKPAQHLQEAAAVTGPEKPPDGMPGGFSSLSANLGVNGILWTSWPLGDAQAVYVPGRLAAFDALSLQELWHDDGGYILPSPFRPTIGEGKVFRATSSGTVLVYGLLPKTGIARVAGAHPDTTGGQDI
jgi:hypothetical protein